MRVSDIAPLEETGKLGVMHLKRFWSKTLASRAGKQHPGEPVEDYVLLSGLRAATHEAVSFVVQSDPTFDEFESWILNINGGWIHPAIVKRINAALTGALDRGTPPIAGSENAALSAAGLDFWNQHGYVVLHDAVTPAQCCAAAQAIYGFLSADPSNPDTWYGNPRGHSIWVELLRHPAFQANSESPRIHSAFAQLWGCTDLWISVDQGGFNPSERPDWPFPGPHLHWDVSIAQPAPLGMQGILYLTDTAADQGAFTCVPGFHRRLGDWLAQLPPRTNPRDRTVLDTLGAVPIAGREGDLVIWHHALPHGSSPNRSDRPRVAQYIKMLPSQWEINPIWR